MNKIILMLSLLILIPCIGLENTVSAQEHGNPDAQAIADVKQSLFSGKQVNFNSGTVFDLILMKRRLIAPEPQENKGIQIYGSFIQNWYVRNWTESDWDAEISAMKSAGIEMLLIQSTVDVEIPWGTYSLYPSELPESAGWQMTDQLEYAFESCRKYGIKLMLGTYNDSKWFEYGWGPPGDLREFLAENTRISNLIVSEITEKYLNRYENEFAGWYFYSEIWNIDVSAPEYWEEYADILSGNFNAWTQHMSAVTPGKPLMISSFYNPQLYNASPEKHSEFWQRIFSMTDFRSGDIFAPQDGAGANPYTFPVLDEWTAALKSAADTEPGLIFWSNNENFTESMTPQDVSRFVQQLEITDKYAEKHICFSWNHYYSPTYGNGIYSAYNDKYQEYVRTGTVPE